VVDYETDKEISYTYTKQVTWITSEIYCWMS